MLLPSLDCLEVGWCWKRRGKDGAEGWGGRGEALIIVVIAIVNLFIVCCVEGSEGGNHSRNHRHSCRTRPRSCSSRLGLLVGIVWKERGGKGWGGKG